MKPIIVVLLVVTVVAVVVVSRWSGLSVPAHADVVEGEELMEVEDVSRLVVADPYNPERDFIKYADTSVGSVLRMRTGDVAIFFPEDGHMPSLQWRGTGLVRKTVVKVPVA